MTSSTMSRGAAGIVSSVRWRGRNAPLTRPRRPPKAPSGRPSPSARSASGASRAGLGQPRIVELVAADLAAGRPERAVGQQAGGPVAEVHPALGEAGRVAEQAEHGVRLAVGILQRFAQHHEAAALAMHRAGRAKALHPGAEIRRRGEPAGMQLRIAAGQPGRRRSRRPAARRRAARTARSRHRQRASAPRHAGRGRRRRRRAPARCAGRAAAGPPHRRRARGASGAASATMRSRSSERSAMSASRSRCRARSGVLAGLHQPEMALRQRQRGVAQDGADDRNAERLDGVGRQPPVPLAAQPVEHDAGDPHVAVVGGKALGDRGGRLRLAGDVEHQQHRQAVEARQVGRRAGAAGLTPECRRTGPSRFR